MRVPFVKMHGLGNDFVVLDGCSNPLPSVTPLIARRIADRHEGIGCDQLIVLRDSESTDADLRMMIFNADGSEVEACGNASRAVAVLIGKPAWIETAGGTIQATPNDGRASIDMVGSSRVDLQACKLEYSIVSPK